MSWWTDENLSHVVHLWTVENWSAGKIANSMATTKNTIIGKVWRMGLRKKVLEPKPQPSASLDKFPRSGCCVFPLGDMKADGHFCGALAVFPRPYCAEHCAIAYQRPTAKPE